MMFYYWIDWMTNKCLDKRKKERDTKIIKLITNLLKSQNELLEYLDD